MKFSRAVLLLTTTLTCNGGAAATSGPCALAGPDYLAARAPSGSSSIEKAIAAFEKTVTDALKNSSSSIPLDAEGTTFSFEAWSIHEDKPIYTYHYDATGLSNPSQGIKNVGSDTTYRIGSLSKLLTVYTWLATAGNKHWQHPITDFIPELQAYDTANADDNDIDHFRWSDITVGLLASHLSGLQKDPALPELVYTALAPIKGLPASTDLPSNALGLQCDTFSKIACTRESYINSILVSHPVYAPGSHAVYSDMAYSLLALALENITGTPFQTHFEDKLIGELGLSSTSYFAPKDLSNSIIPINDTTATFTPSLGLLQPGGGFYSSLNDVTKIGRAMLGNTLLSPRLTRSWMKPASFLADGVSAAGAPWEIYQTLGTDRPIWMYTKSGDLGIYSSNLMLLPDFDAGFTILAAGAQASTVTRVLADVAATVFAPAFEGAAKEEAVAGLAGDYTGYFDNASGNGTDTFEIVLTADDGPGLLMSNYTVNQVDMRVAFAAFNKITVDQIQLRLYPTRLTSKDKDGKTLQGFRMVRYRPLSTDPAPPGAVFSSMRCQEWFNIGGYTSRTGRGVDGALDEFAFVMGNTGAEGLIVKTWNRQLERTAGSEVVTPQKEESKKKLSMGVHYSPFGSFD